MVTSKYMPDGSFRTIFDYHIQSFRILIYSNQDRAMVFDTDLYTLEIQDIIGMTIVSVVLSFIHLIDIITYGLDTMDYTEPTIINVPAQNPFESFSIIFDYIDENNIHFEIYKRNDAMHQSILMSDIIFDQDNLINFLDAILSDFLESNHKIEAIARLRDNGIIIST